MIKENSFNDVNTKIINLARDRDTASPNYKSKEVLSKHNFISQDNSYSSLLNNQVKTKFELEQLQLKRQRDALAHVFYFSKH